MSKVETLWILTHAIIVGLFCYFLKKKKNQIWEESGVADVSADNKCANKMPDTETRKHAHKVGFHPMNGGHCQLHPPPTTR